MARASHRECYVATTGRQPKSDRRARTSNLECVDCGKPIALGASFAWYRDNVNGARHGAAKVGEGESVFTQGSEPTTMNVTTPVASPAIEPSPVSAPPRSSLSPIAAAILSEIEPHVRAQVDAAQVDARIANVVTQERATMLHAVSELIAKHVSAQAPQVTVVHVKKPDAEPVNAGVQHKQFPELLSALAAGVNVALVGPAGTGKTTAVHNAANALGLAYSYSGTTNDPILLSGYIDANGKYVPTLLRERCEGGGLHLFDELDAWDANATTWLNAMLANGTAAFPDRMVERKCTLAATMNTYGLGGTAEYVGRNRLDGAFLDRWVFMPWEIDEDLERVTVANQAWVKRVQDVRRRVRERGIKVLITPRASYQGSALLAQGLPQERVEIFTLKRGMTDAQWESIR